MKWERLFKQQYYMAKKPSSFGGIHSLARATKKKPQQVVPWLQEQDTYTLHRPAQRFGCSDLVWCGQGLSGYTPQGR